ncbi:MAG: FmdB family zinc ribbon protein [Planctomycetota bacterium]
MPTYEYVCRACGHEFEEFQSIKADPIAVCPKCRKRKVERKIGIGGAVIFKGGGFYETDYRSESYAKGEKAEREASTPASEAKAGTDAKSTPKPETAAKPDAKTAAKPDAKPDPKPDSKQAAPADPGVASERRRIESRATHPSRIGRGIGNIVKQQAKPAAKGGKSASARKKR